MSEELIDIKKFIKECLNEAINKMINEIDGGTFNIYGIKRRYWSE